MKRKGIRTMKLPIVLEGNQREGYTATCPALPGCVSEGETRQEAIKNIREAIRLYLRAVTREHIKSILKAAGLTISRLTEPLHG